MPIFAIPCENSRGYLPCPRIDHHEAAPGRTPRGSTKREAACKLQAACDVDDRLAGAVEVVRGGANFEVVSVRRARVQSNRSKRRRRGRIRREPQTFRARRRRCRCHEADDRRASGQATDEGGRDRRREVANALPEARETTRLRDANASRRRGASGVTGGCSRRSRPRTRRLLAKHGRLGQEAGRYRGRRQGLMRPARGAGPVPRDGGGEPDRS